MQSMNISVKKKDEVMKMKITKKEHLRILLCRAEKLKQIHTNFIRRLLLEGKVSVEDIPFEIRTSNKSIYITALRCVRDNSEMFGKTLYQLRSDIEKLERSEQIEEFISLYIDYGRERLAVIERCHSQYQMRGRGD
ncbi:MAG: hypothetical protein ACI4RP_08050 [Acutalibacteraceae bacterium]